MSGPYGCQCGKGRRINAARSRLAEYRGSAVFWQDAVIRHAMRKRQRIEKCGSVGIFQLISTKFCMKSAYGPGKYCLGSYKKRSNPYLSAATIGKRDLHLG